jgi:hypothetical protein
MESAVKGIEHAVKNYNQDLEALTEEQILGCAGGAARKPVDFTYEVALINLRIAARLNGLEPPPAPEGDEWWVAPDELRSKSAISEYMRSASLELIEAAKAIPEEEGSKLVGPPGSERPAFALTNFASMHTMYHDAQLNFIQSLHGDLDMHWS